jgi:hypothetical protein
VFVFVNMCVIILVCVLVVNFFQFVNIFVKKI